MNVKMFIAKYHNKGIVDDGAYQSPHFKAFARDFREMARDAGRRVGAQLEGFHTGHYDVSGFFRRGDKFCYFSYNVPRGKMPIDCEARSAHNGILVRTAANERDFRGGRNSFCNFSEFQEMIDRKLQEG